MSNHKNEIVKVIDVEKIKEFQGIISTWVGTPPGIEEFDRQLSDWCCKLPRQYSDSYPALDHPIGQYLFPTNILQPTSLAEALLWKLGKWDSFKKFVSSYTSNDPEIPEKAVVFHSFARHLAEEKKPIFDQHALRAAWAICETKNCIDQKIRSSLFTPKGNWKSSGSGKDYKDCVKIYYYLIKLFLPQEYTRKNLVNLDRFLMPLGQIIKKQTDNINKFEIFVGKNLTKNNQ